MLIATDFYRIKNKVLNFLKTENTIAIEGNFFCPGENVFLVMKNRVLGKNFFFVFLNKFLFPKTLFFTTKKTFFPPKISRFPPLFYHFWGEGGGRKTIPIETHTAFLFYFEFIYPSCVNNVLTLTEFVDRQCTIAVVRYVYLLWTKINRKFHFDFFLIGCNFVFWVILILQMINVKIYMVLVG